MGYFTENRHEINPSCNELGGSTFRNKVKPRLDQLDRVLSPSTWTSHTDKEHFVLEMTLVSGHEPGEVRCILVQQSSESQSYLRRMGKTRNERTHRLQLHLLEWHQQRTDHPCKQGLVSVSPPPPPPPGGINTGERESLVPLVER